MQFQERNHRLKNEGSDVYTGQSLYSGKILDSGVQLTHFSYHRAFCPIV